MDDWTYIERLAAQLRDAHTDAAINRVVEQAGEAPAAVQTLSDEIVQLARDHAQAMRRVSDLSRRAYRDNRALRDELKKYGTAQLVAYSSGMRDVIERADLVARHPSTVLIQGESGTGKELIARRIHSLSNRAHRPFVRVNCGALPESLIESELFGHERGAFTGADRRHIGRFERAHRGTLFLDEVAELTPSAQVKLLRVLQEGELERLGGEETISVDVRVIAATHQDPARLREDLYYRINVFALEIPPLRERLDDIPALVQSLVPRIARRLGAPVPEVDARTIEALQQHHWPGNVRELENLLENALIQSTGSLRLPPGFRPVRSSSRKRITTLDDAIRAHIERALTATSGRIYGENGAAEKLGLNPSTLQSKMRKLGIDREAFVR